MNYILKFTNPFEGVYQIKVYAPHMSDENTVSFLVILDGQYSIFELFEDGHWGECGISHSFTPEIIQFIQEQIQAKYL